MRVEPAPMAGPLKAPFPWFGGKSRAAALIWSRFGDVDNYVEPFFGSGAVLLARPTLEGSETVNDIDCYLANFWRAIAADPHEVARHADWPVNEADLHSRHAWLVSREAFREQIKTEPEFFDARVAGWWAWGLSCWIGGGWCHLPADRRERRRPQMTAGRNGNVLHGVPRRIPNVDARGNKGTASHQVPRMDAMCNMGAANAVDLVPWFEALASRLRRTRVACGDWMRVLGPTPLGLTNNVPARFRTAVLLDPPYAPDIRDPGLYANDGHASLSADVREWAVAHGHEQKLRIALCGYEGEHAMPADWECVAWKANGGYGNRTGNENARRERVWFSPNCLKPDIGQRELGL